MPVVVDDVVEIVKVAVAEPYGGNVTLVELIETVKHERLAHVAGGVRFTVPWKPPMLVTAMMDVPLDPWGMIKDCGLADIAKSPEVDWTIRKVTVTECDKLPLMPVTVTLPSVGNPPANIVSVAMANPFEKRVTLVGLMDHPVQPGQRSGGDT